MATPGGSGWSGWGPNDRPAPEPIWSSQYAGHAYARPEYAARYPPPPPPNPAPRWGGRGPVLLIGALVVVIVLVVAGSLVRWWSHQRSDDATGPVPGQLTKEFPTAPSVAWKVTADQLGADALTLSSPRGDGFYSFPPALVDDGGVAVAVEEAAPSYGTSANLVVAGVNVATGQPWTTHIAASCPEQIVTHLIACNTSDGEQQRFAFVDVRTGTQSGTAVVPDGKGGEPAFDGEAVYLTSTANGSAMRVTKVDRAGKEIWSVQPDVPSRPGPGFAWTTIGGGLVGASTNGDAVLSATDGHLLSTSVGAGQVLADGSLVGSTGSDDQGRPSGYRSRAPERDDHRTARSRESPERLGRADAAAARGHITRSGRDGGGRRSAVPARRHHVDVVRGDVDQSRRHGHRPHHRRRHGQRRTARL